MTGGGDVQPLNALIDSVQKKSFEADIEVFGYIKGWDGVLKDLSVSLSKIRMHPSIGGTVLKSSRINLSKIENGIEIVLDNLSKNRISGLIVAGGEDTLSNSFLIQDIPQVLISKTIDNDVGILHKNDQKLNLEKDIMNYFTLGYPTAAEKLVSFISLKEGLRTTAYSHERIIIVEAMGMHAGWLALASGMGYPDFIVVPEFPLRYDLLLEKIRVKYERQKNVIIVISEGAKWEDDSFLCAPEDQNKSFNHPRFGGASNVLKDRLKKDLTKYFDTRYVNSVNPSYLYRAGKPNKLDMYWARKLGKYAIKYFAEPKRESAFLSIQKNGSGFSIKPVVLSKYHSMDKLHRFVDKRFYNPDEFGITALAKDYLSKIIKDSRMEMAYGIG